MLSAQLGHFLDKPLSGLAKHIRVNPNILTITGFLITAAAAVILSHNLFAGGLLIGLGGIFDMLDGMVARVNGRATKFGAFLDSVLDRYSDAFLFFGFAWYFMEKNPIEFTGVLLSLIAAVGAFLVSYTRARAEGLGKECKIGLLERPERIILMVFGALTGWIIPVMLIMAVLTNITVFQRISYVYKSLKTKE